MQFSKLFSCVLLAFVCLSFYQCTSSIWQGVALARRQGRYESAEQQVERYLRTHPNDARAYYTLGEIRAQRRNWAGMQEAFRSCEKADKSWRRETETAREYHWAKNYNAGLSSLQAENLQLARDRFQAGTLIFPRRAISQRLYGEASLAAGDTVAAQAAFERVLVLDPRDARARRHAMLIYFATGAYEKALAQADFLLQQAPLDVEALRLRAYSLDRLRETGRATEAYKKLLAISKRAADPEAFAAFQYRNGEYRSALALGQTAIERGGNQLQNLRAIAQCHLMLQDFRNLDIVAQQILALQQNSLVALQLRRYALVGLGKPVEAEAVSQKIKKLMQKP